MSIASGPVYIDMLAREVEVGMREYVDEEGRPYELLDDITEAVLNQILYRTPYSFFEIPVHDTDSEDPIKNNNEFMEDLNYYTPAMKKVLNEEDLPVKATRRSRR